VKLTYNWSVEQWDGALFVSVVVRTVLVLLFLCSNDNDNGALEVTLAMLLCLINCRFIIKKKLIIGVYRPW